MSSNTIDIYYDGECPYCNNFVSLAKLKKNYSVNLHDLRTMPETVKKFRDKGHDINEGMIVMLGDDLYFGGDAISIIAKLSNKNYKIGKVYYVLFSNTAFAKFIYPALRCGRNITLALRGTKKID